MTREEALAFLDVHAEWLKENWSLTPEGRAYREKFLEAVAILHCEEGVCK